MLCCFSEGCEGWWNGKTFNFEGESGFLGGSCSRTMLPCVTASNGVVDAEVFQKLSPDLVLVILLSLDLTSRTEAY